MYLVVVVVVVKMTSYFRESKLQKVKEVLVI